MQEIVEPMASLGYTRKRIRLKMVLGVRVIGHAASGNAFDELTHTLDIAREGVRLGGMGGYGLQKGDIIEIRRRTRRAQFRVKWVGEPGTPRTGHIGMEAIEISPDFWGLEIPPDRDIPSAEITQQIANRAAAGGARR
jgi:hypothetical protein